MCVFAWKLRCRVARRSRELHNSYARLVHMTVHVAQPDHPRVLVWERSLCPRHARTRARAARPASTDPSAMWRSGDVGKVGKVASGHVDALV